MKLAYAVRTRGPCNHMKTPRNKNRAADQTTITMSIPIELKELIQRAAASDRRSCSNWAAKILAEYLDAKAVSAKPRK